MGTGWKKWPSGIAHWFGSFLFPDACVRCGRTSGRFPLCSVCRNEAAAMPAIAPELPVGLESLHAGLELSEPVRALVHGLKYQGERRNAAALAELAVGARGIPALPAGALLVPVPVHSTRKRERGYNQALLLAREWSKRLDVPVCDCLDRVRSTGTQTHLDAAARRANLESALRVNKAFVRDRPLVLVDDICTTGSTLGSCAAVLLRAGAVEVHGLACAWAPGK
jgi:ComF family protein